MMKLRTLIAAAPLVLIAGTVGASESSSSTADAVVPGSANDHVEGKISAVRSGAISIVSQSGETTTLSVNPRTAVELNDRDASYEQLKEGQAVRASYNDASEGHAAVEIRAFDVKPAAPAPARTPAKDIGRSWSTTEPVPVDRE